MPNSPETSPRILRFIIEQRERMYANSESGNLFTGRSIRVARNSFLGAPYPSLSDFSNTDEVKIYLIKGNTPSEVKLPPEMQERFATYLRREKDLVERVKNRDDVKTRVIESIATLASRYPGNPLLEFLKKSALNRVVYETPQQLYDCASFAHDMNGLFYEFSQFNADVWKYSEFTGTENLEPGTTIAMGYSKAGGIGLTHQAIYLGEDLFISKFGPAKLIVTDIANMKIGFNATEVVICRPKKAEASGDDSQNIQEIA